MGAWGTGVFDDDLALDVRGTWEDALAAEGSPSAASAQVMRKLGYTAEDPDDALVFWLALASLQLDAGALDPGVKQNALGGIDPDLQRWRDEGSADDAAARERVLNELRDRLEAA